MKCTVYFRGDDVYVLASAKNSFGIYESAEPFSKLPRTAGARAIGESVLASLAAYREGIPGKTYARGVKRPLHPFLDFAGFKSWRAFERGVRYVSVSREASQVTITPGVPYPKGGFAHHPERAVVTSADAAEIGRALIALADDGG